MITTKLITLAEIQAYKQISSSVFLDKLNEIILETQFNDLQPLLGERLFLAILDDQATYADLLNGSTYTYNGITYTNYGLKSVIAHYVYARYAMFGDLIDNPFGITSKLNLNESKPIDYAFKKNLFNNNKQTAYNYWLNVEKFLIRTKEPLFNCGVGRVNNTFKMTNIR